MLAGNQHEEAEALCPPAAARLSERASVLSVCHIASGDRWAGAEVQVATLLRTLAGNSDISLCVVLLNDGALAEEIRACGIPLLIVPESRHNFVSVFLRIRDFLKDRKIQIIHSHRYKENLLGMLAARSLGIPHTVRTQHGMPEPVAGLAGLKVGAINTLDRAVAKCTTDRIVAVSREMGSKLAHGGIDGKLVVIHNGVDLGRVGSELSVAEARIRLGIPPDAMVVGTAGRLEPVKRLDLFVRAAYEISVKEPSCHFVIVGDGTERAAIATLVEELRLTDRFTILAHQPQVFDVLRGFDVFVMTSDHEGLPTVLLEAMYLGVSVVARAVGGIPEVIEQGVSGELVSSNNPVEIAAGCLRALAPTRAARMRVAARAQVADQFSAERNAKEVLNLYRALTGLQ